jgi:tripartite-type tricarboxylate transporter receptor subunit TctC
MVRRLLPFGSPLTARRSLFFDQPTLRACLLCAFCAVLPTAAAAAADYPTKPIRLVVAQAPGGNADIVARAVAQKIGEALRQQVVIDNRGGGGGVIGAEVVAHAAPDGYTLLLVSSAFGVNPSLQQRLPYDPIASFAPITLVAFSPDILVVHPAVPVRTVKDLIALARAKPGSLNFGSSGSGGSTHLAGELFKHLARVDMVHVPYKGAAAALIDLIAGNVQLMFASMPSAIGHVRASKLRAIAVTSVKRSIALPDLPTVAESGLADFETTAWQGMFAPAGTPPRIIATLNSEVARAVRSPDLRDRLVTEGSEPVGNSPNEFSAYVKREIKRWSDVVKATGMRAG